MASTGQIKNLPAIYQSLSDMVYTNLSFEQICALAVFGAGFDDWNNVGQYTLSGEYHTAYGVYYYLLDQQAKADLVKKVFGATIGIDEKHDINYVLGDHNNKDAQSESNNEDDQTEPDESEESDDTFNDEDTPLNTPSEDQPSAGTEPSAGDETSAGTDALEDVD
jgi:anionic cell wall polymer biosynthesis LytR-Cps2A-Psr (LCP) family protein